MNATDKTAHTPTPWPKIDTAKDGDPILSAEDYELARHCVNTHAALVAALEKGRAVLDGHWLLAVAIGGASPRLQQQTVEAMRIMDAALAAAKEVTP